MEGKLVVEVPLHLRANRKQRGGREREGRREGREGETGGTGRERETGGTGKEGRSRDSWQTGNGMVHIHLQ